MSKAFSEEQKQEWREKIEQQQASGESKAKWCRKNNISPDSFYYWQSRLYPKNSAVSFAEIKNVNRAEIYLECKGVKVYISDKQYDSKFLKILLQDLRELQC